MLLFTTYYTGRMDAIGMRQRNLSRILQLVHREGALSRAALTEATGLNRSTVAALVAELAAQQLVAEKAPDPARRAGRPSPIVTPQSRTVAIAVNPEVDAVTLAAVGLDLSIPVRARVTMPQAPTPAETAALVTEHIDRWRGAELADHGIVGVGLAVPGLVRTGDGLVRDAPHLGWRDVPLAEIIRDATALPTAIGNDASLGVLAEHLFGAARGMADVVYLNGGASGIGGGVIVAGSPLAGTGGYAGEFGQNRPGIEHAADRRVAGGVLEDEVNRSLLLTALGLTDADDAQLTDAVAAASGQARAEIERQQRILATALANAVNVLNPSAVVLGGFLAALCASDLGALGDAVRAQSMPACAETLELRLASLAEDRLLIGAGELAFADLLSDPSEFSPR